MCVNYVGLYNKNGALVFKCYAINVFIYFIMLIILGRRGKLVIECENLCGKSRKVVKMRHE